MILRDVTITIQTERCHPPYKEVMSCRSRAMSSGPSAFSCASLQRASVARSAGDGAVPERQVEPAEKRLPPGAIARLGSLRLRHEQEVRALAISADSKLVASIAQ